MRGRPRGPARLRPGRSRQGDPRLRQGDHREFPRGALPVQPRARLPAQGAGPARRRSGQAQDAGRCGDPLRGCGQARLRRRLQQSRPVVRQGRGRRPRRSGRGDAPAAARRQAGPRHGDVQSRAALSQRPGRAHPRLDPGLRAVRQGRRGRQRGRDGAGRRVAVDRLRRARSGPGARARMAPPRRQCRIGRGQALSRHRLPAGRARRLGRPQRPVRSRPGAAVVRAGGRGRRFRRPALSRQDARGRQRPDQRSSRSSPSAIGGWPPTTATSTRRGSSPSASCRAAC